MTRRTQEAVRRLGELLEKGVCQSDSGWFVDSYTDDGLSEIRDGLSDGMFPVVCERPQADLIVAAINALPSLLAHIAALEAEVEPFARPSAELLDQVGEAIVRARCPGRQGPYGGFDYGYNEEFYGPAPKAGRYVIRDMRHFGSETWDAVVHQTNDKDEHEAAFERLTRRHIAREALRAAARAMGDER